MIIFPYGGIILIEFASHEDYLRMSIVFDCIEKSPLSNLI